MRQLNGKNRCTVLRIWFHISRTMRKILVKYRYHINSETGSIQLSTTLTPPAEGFKCMHVNRISIQPSSYKLKVLSNIVKTFEYANSQNESKYNDNLTVDAKFVVYISCKICSAISWDAFVRKRYRSKKIMKCESFAHRPIERVPLMRSLQNRAQRMIIHSVFKSMNAHMLFGCAQRLCWVLIFPCSGGVL
jgi:hypothetical protein